MQKYPKITKESLFDPATNALIIRDLDYQKGTKSSTLNQLFMNTVLTQTNSSFFLKISSALISINKGRKYLDAIHKPMVNLRKRVQLCSDFRFLVIIRRCPISSRFCIKQTLSSKE